MSVIAIQLSDSSSQLLNVQLSVIIDIVIRWRYPVTTSPLIITHVLSINKRYHNPRNWSNSLIMHVVYLRRIYSGTELWVSPWEPR